MNNRNFLKIKVPFFLRMNIIYIKFERYIEMDEIKISIGTKNFVMLPKVTMSNGISIWYFDPYNMEHAYILNEHIDKIIKNNDVWMYNVDTVVVPATKPIAYAWSIAYKLHANLVVLKKERKPYHTDVLYFDRSEESVTSDRRSEFFIEKFEAEKIKNKQVLFFDDVVSSGATWKAAKKFLDGLKPKDLKSLFLFKEGNSVDNDLTKNEMFIGEIPLIK